MAIALGAAESPFDGVTLSLSKLNLEGLWRCYSIVARTLAALKMYDSYTDNPDWDWHDDYISNGGPVSHAEWMSWLETPETLAAAWRTEDYVHWGIYPPDKSWYLRFYLWEDQTKWDDLGMDVTGERALIESIRAALGDVPTSDVEIAPASTWFKAHGNTVHWLERKRKITESDLRAAEPSD